MPICRFAAEPPQGGLPSEDTLKAEFLAACLKVETDPDDPDLGTAGDIHWFPDRTWSGRTYVPATARTDTGLELFGYVSFAPGDEPGEIYAWADYTPDVADDHPEWQMDISQEVVGGWRGAGGQVAAMTLIWGVPMISSGRIVTAELGRVTVDEAEIEGERFTLLAPDAYDDTFLEVVLRDGAGNALAHESLYEEE
ncbi:hypothetical protein DVA67_013870 [Solirubrobacter sp. CPCC 204708]|uniref:Uncharacterized protein n=1 Tax=Solirubrobacter deserti TaxID=2282478 RepID=A0ABT4RBY8_9ACTN|nr:hypothetical protein [Solirubrobacter deserti]MBE2317064.1 hypothetical protein [Solirubrobacter deserti]MDA0136044.1 hypothetical protein [Solirubrobacter deserti]